MYLTNVTQNFTRSKSLIGRPSEPDSVVRRRSFQPESNIKSANLELILENNRYLRSPSILSQKTRSYSKKCRTSSVYHIKKTLHSKRRSLVHRSLSRNIRNKQSADTLASELHNYDAVNFDEGSQASFDIRHEEGVCTARFNSAQENYDSINSTYSVNGEQETNVCLDDDSCENLDSGNDKKVEVHEAMWFILSLLSFWGLNIFVIEDKITKVCKLKMAVCIAHMIFVIAAFVYTVDFIFTPDFPFWFRVFTMSFAFTHLYAFAQYVTILRIREKFISFYNHLSKIKVKYSSIFHIAPMWLFLYSLVSMLMLFYVMPEEAYVVTFLLISSLFMPGTIDNFVGAVMEMFSQAFREIEREISATSNWTVPKLVKLSKQLRFMHNLIESFNKVSFFNRDNQRLVPVGHMEKILKSCVLEHVRLIPF